MSVRLAYVSNGYSNNHLFGELTLALQIRELTKSDYTAIKEIFIESNRFHEEVDPMFTTVEDADQIWLDFIDSIAQQKDYIIYIACFNHTVVGFCVGQIIDKPPIFQEKKAGYIDIIAVRNDYKRQGIGKELFDSLHKWFKAYNVNHIELSAATNNPQSVGFWKKVGDWC